MVGKGLRGVPLLMQFRVLPFRSAPDREMCQALVQLFLSCVDDESLLLFVRHFLLQSNSTPLRWQVKLLQAAKLCSLHSQYLSEMSTLQLYIHVGAFL